MYVGYGVTLTDTASILENAISTLGYMVAESEEVFTLHGELTNNRWTNEGYDRWDSEPYNGGGGYCKKSMEQGLLKTSLRYIEKYIAYIENYEKAVLNIHKYTIVEERHRGKIARVTQRMHGPLQELIFWAKLVQRGSDPGINRDDAHNVKLPIQIPSWVDL